MHNATTRAAATSHGEVHYRERLTPSLWTLLSATLVAPMVSLVFVPLDPTVALLAGMLVGIGVLALLVLSSPVVAVRDGELRVGRAHIPVRLLGAPEQLRGAEARQGRGPGLGRNDWHLLRGGIDALVRVPVMDPDDPVDQWVFSTRTPDRVAAAITRAQRAD